jgi:hypothetical protein
VVKTDQVSDKYYRHYGRDAPEEWAARQGAQEGSAGDREPGA